MTYSRFAKINHLIANFNAMPWLDNPIQTGPNRTGNRIQLTGQQKANIGPTGFVRNKNVTADQLSGINGFNTGAKGFRHNQLGTLNSYQQNAPKLNVKRAIKKTQPGFRARLRKLANKKIF